MANPQPKASRALRVLHSPRSVGGNPQGLACAERELGLDSTAVIFEQNYFQYKADEVLLPNGANPLTVTVKRWQLLARALRDFDIIHFNFGQSFMAGKVAADAEAVRRYPVPVRWLYQSYTQLLELRDLPLLKRLGKGIVVTYQGDDARQGDFTRANFAINMANEVEYGYYSPASDQHKRWRIARFAAYADRIFALNPDLLHVLPPQAQFLPYSHIDLREWTPVYTAGVAPKKPVVLHAPSHRGAKGTRFVLDAMARLQQEGVELEFILVEGLSHAEARKLYAQADLLIDQVLAGWYGGLAVELMALGKPVMCYIREEDLKFIPAQMRTELPIINTTPATLYDTLKLWLTTRQPELATVGQRSRRYVENWHDPLKIAARMQTEYETIMASKQRKDTGR